MDDNNKAPPLPPAVPARPAISISLTKKKKKASTAPKLQLSSAEEEYSTIAEHAEALSKKRAEEGNILVIPCTQQRDTGKPLLAQRQDVSAHATHVDGDAQTQTDGDEDDEATRQLIELATNRPSDTNSKSNKLTISAPQQNTLNVKPVAGASANDDELFRRDLSSRADDIDPTSSTYANISIGDFGGALLRGMGWTGSGGDTKKKEEEIKSRPHRLGLGATPLLPPPSGKHGRVRRPEELKKEEERQKIEEEREKKRLEMIRLDVQYTLQKGSIVKVSDARAKVVQVAGVPGLNRILVRLEHNGKEEPVNKSSVTLCSWDELERDPFREVRVDNGASRKDDGSKRNGDDSRGNEAKSNGSRRDDYNDERDKRRNKESRDYSDDDSRYGRKRNKKSSRDKHYSSDDDSRYKRKRKESRRDKHYSSDEDSRYKRKKESKRRKRERSEERDSSRGRKHRDRDDDRRRDRYDKEPTFQQEHFNWLLPNIRIRLVSKKYPRQHLQKGIVQDVIPSQNNNPNAVILMDNQEVLDNIPERYLETALPKIGGNVIVLEGSHRWKKGRLLERSSGKGTGVIQLFEDLEVVEVSLDGVAEWCGPLDEDME